MDGTKMLRDALELLWRRKLRTFLALVVSLALAAGAFFLVPPTQRSTAQVLFVPSVKQPGVEGPTNPFLSLDGSVAVTASVVQIQVSDDETAERLAAQGAVAEYEVEPNLSENAGPVLIITVEDPSAATTTKTLRAVIAEVKSTLRQVQLSQGIKQDLMVSSLVLTADPVPEVVRTKQIRAAVVALVGSLGLLLGLVLVAERRRLRVGRRIDTYGEVEAAKEPSHEFVPATPEPPIDREEALATGAEGDAHEGLATARGRR